VRFRGTAFALAAQPVRERPVDDVPLLAGNPEGPGRQDVAALLRRVADAIEALGDVEVFDITYAVEVTAEGGSPR
jgi:hypothetical protein